MYEVLNTSMIGYTTYMQHRMPSYDMDFFINDDNLLCMRKYVNIGDHITIIFKDEINVDFIYATPSWSITKSINRAATFNGAMIEFLTMDRDHFIQIRKDLEKSPALSKQYSYMDINSKVE